MRVLFDKDLQRFEQHVCSCHWNLNPHLDEDVICSGSWLHWFHALIRTKWTSGWWMMCKSRKRTLSERSCSFSLLFFFHINVVQHSERVHERLRGPARFNGQNGRVDGARILCTGDTQLLRCGWVARSAKITLPVSFRQFAPSPWGNNHEHAGNPRKSVRRAARTLQERAEAARFLETIGQSDDAGARRGCKHNSSSITLHYAKKYRLFPIKAHFIQFHLFEIAFQETGVLMNEEMRMYATMFDLYADDRLFREVFSE